MLVISVSARRRGEGGRGSDRRIRIQERKCKVSQLNDTIAISSDVVYRKNSANQ